ncbi:hypothetical protein [Pseudobythopirellula maris]|uniref:hypothetical protein n=1 Tax=Pseudobythopirellula maris TaxID=2527991 RepID=UPI0018D41D85|nr:hypothetical protein [Pseudobythopirellula maris]
MALDGEWSLAVSNGLRVYRDFEYSYTWDPLGPGGAPTNFGEIAIDGTHAAAVIDDSVWFYDLQTRQTLASFGAEAMAGVSSAAASVHVSVDLWDGLAVVGVGSFYGNGSVPGKAYVVDATTGELLRELTSESDPPTSQYAHSVAISEGRVLVGDPTYSGSLSSAGAAYLFDLDSGEQIVRLDLEDPAVGESLGGAVDLDGTAAVIGASRHGTPHVGSGAVYFYDIESPNSLVRHEKSVTGIRVYNGSRVAVSGDVAASAPNVLYGYSNFFSTVPEPSSSYLAAVVVAWGAKLRRRRA